ncbi:hypothetical protein [Photobacterium sp. GB-1]|uniref:hypothetical protein n=1 Tax=Photobacterium sp. GB-1 TaxID=2022111 RepID=UPI0011B21217|nr:hypothetical protein [Photobacterium sp. GB-1]
MNNIDAFNIAVAEILGECYREFPLRVRLSKLDIGETIKIAMGDDPDGVHNLSEKEYEIAEEAMNWLMEAGYIWSREPDNRISMEGVTLSPKGLEILNAVPETLQEKKTLGDLISGGVKTIGKDVATTSVKTVLTYGLKLSLGT